MFKKKIKEKKKIHLNALIIIVCPLLLIYAFTLFFPLAWAFMTSLKTHGQFYTDALDGNYFTLPDISLWKGKSIFSNYTIILSLFKTGEALTQRGLPYSSPAYDTIFGKVLSKTIYPTIWEVIYNTISYTVGTTIVYVFWCASTAYLCAKYRYKLSGIITFFAIFAITTPIFGANAAAIKILRSLHLYNEIYGRYIHNATFATMHYLIFYAFFENLSNTYNEAAEIDGASQLRIMYSICMPMAMTMIVTIFLLSFVTKWNDYGTALMFMPLKPTLAFVILKNIHYVTSSPLVQVPNKFAALMVLAIPILVLFIFLKNRLMGNISLGGIKE